MPLIETKGAASAQGFGLTLSSGPATYIEDVFSTWLYTGNGSTQTITNGIDLSTKGGLVWLKGRSGATNNALYDTTRGATKDLVSNSTAVETTQSTGLTAFSGTGFSIGALAKLNTSAATYVSWTFRKQPKFFDVVTYTGNGTVGRTIAHNLGSAPGCIIVKATNNTTKWVVWHRSGTQSNRYGAFLNDTSAYTDTLTQLWGATGGTPAMTSTSFSVGDAVTTNDYFNTYVAYVFAHDAGGFGLSGTDNVISCGSFTTSAGQTASVSLGWEPQWLLVKSTSATGDWWLIDTMRGLPGGLVTSGSRILFSNLASAELNGTLGVNATGFDVLLNPSTTYIYIAIRRSPMKVPTSGTSVFSPISRTGTSSKTTISTGFKVDLGISRERAGTSYPWQQLDRLRGLNKILFPYSTNAEITDRTSADPEMAFDTQNGVIVGSWDSINSISTTYINYFFQRAPGFFDEVCYTGTGANATQAHNLSAVPQMMIVKKRSATSNWAVYHSALGAVGWILLNSSAAASSGADFWQSTTPTAVNFYTGTNGNVGDSGQTYVAYLFATCAGVSKVGSYTGTGALQTVNCGFTGGARFVLIKRTDSTGDWYVYDSARGISSGNDPYLLLNSTAAEVTGTNYVDTTSVGFQVTAAAPAGLNANGGTYIFLAIA